jgi:hypothetical protein
MRGGRDPLLEKVGSLGTRIVGVVGVGDWVAWGTGWWWNLGVDDRARLGDARSAAVRVSAGGVARDDTGGVKPEGGEGGPMLFGSAGGVNAEAVASGGEVVKFSLDVGVHESTVVDDSVLAVALVVLRLNKEGDRREAVRRVDGVKLRFFRRRCQVGRVADDGEVGAGVDRDAVDGGDIRGGGGGHDVCIVRMGAEKNGEIATSGETDDTDTVAIYTPFAGMLASKTHSLLRIFKIAVVGGIFSYFRDTVFDEETGNADGVEPFAGVCAFAVPGEADIASARKDEGGDAGTVVGGLVDADGGLGDVGEALRAATVEERVRGLGGVDLGVRNLWRLGRAVGPERKDALLGVKNGGLSGKEDGGEECEGSVAHAVHST